MTFRKALCLAALLGLPWPARAKTETLPVRVLNNAGRPVPDAVVYVREVKGEAFTPPAEPYVMDQIDQQFSPHILPILVGGRVRFPNQDDIHHSLFSFSPAKTFELPLYKGEPADPVAFEKPGVVKLGCNIHDWMSGVILVLSNPYFAVTGEDGSAGLPVPKAGRYELEVFHEGLKGQARQT